MPVAKSTWAILESRISRYASLLPLVKPLSPALIELGKYFAQRSQFVISLELYCQALAINSQLVEGWNSLGLLLSRQGDLDSAAATLSRSLSISPNQSEVAYQLGVVFSRLEKWELAASWFQRAVTLSPGFSEAHNNLGLAWLELNRPALAQKCFRRALEIQPQFVAALNNSGNALLALGKPAAAIEAFQKLVSIDPNYPPVYNNLGNAYIVLERFDMALSCFLVALAFRPEASEIFNNIGTLLDTLGKFDQSRAFFLKAIELTPNKPEYYYNLSKFGRFNLQDTQSQSLKRMEQYINDYSLPDQILLHFALAKMYEDLREYEQSFHHQIRGNLLKRGMVVYDEPGTLKLYERIKKVFQAGLFERNAGQGNSSEEVVFIVGMPRSGTTLVEQILASHPQVKAAGECVILEDLIKRFPEIIKLYHPVKSLPFHQSLFPEACLDLPPEFFKNIGALYLENLRAKFPAGSARRIVDKMPGNFRFAGLITLIFPNARIIHVQRNAVDTCLSAFSKLFKSGCTFSYDLGELGRHHRAYVELMKHWRSVLPCHTMIEVTYEAITEDLESEARRMIDFIGLDWDDRCLQFYQTDRPILTASAAQVRLPIYKTSVYRWRPDPSLLKPLLDALGY